MKVGTFPTKLYFEYEAREKIATNKEKRELSSTSDVKHEGKIRSGLARVIIPRRAGYGWRVITSGVYEEQR